MPPLAKSTAAATEESLFLELTEHNDFFDVLVDMIPSKLYIAGQSGDDYNPKSRYMKKGASDSKAARKAAAKLAKRQKFDPNSVETTVQKKKRLDQQQNHKPQPPQPQPTSPETNKTSEPPLTSPDQSRIEALRQKLHAKIAAKQQVTKKTPDQVSKRAARRAEKRKRQEEAAKRNKKSSTATIKNGAQKTVYQTVEDQAGKASAAADLEQLDYGRLTGLNGSTPLASTNYMEANKALANLNKTKNFQKLLADAEAKRQKLEELKKSDKEHDQKKAQQILWKDTFQEADGHRVKDDPAKLKKALKKRAAKKAKSAKAWKSRMEQQSQAASDRQAIRQHNLSARKQGGAVGANLSRKRIVTANSPGEGKEDQGRRLSRAGFEGRKQDFLNSGGKQ